MSMIKPIIPNETEVSHGYFTGHRCKIPSQKLSPYYIQSSKLRTFIFDFITVSMDDVRARNMYRSHAALCAEKYRQCLYYPLTIHPFSKFRLAIELMFLICGLLSNTMLAVHFSETKPDADFHMSIMCFSDVNIMLNILANLFTGYIAGQSNPVAVLNIRKIVCHYAKTTLIFDILAATCFVPVLLNITTPTTLLIMVSMKLFRLPHLLMYLRNVMTVMRFGVLAKAGIEIFVILFSYLMWNLYFQFGVNYVEEGTFTPQQPSNCSWITLAKLWDKPQSVRFIYAFDRAVGMLRKNYNPDSFKKGECSEFFNIVSWLISMLLIYHCVLLYIMAIVGSDSSTAKYYAMMHQVERYMLQRKFPPRIKKKILKFYNLQFKSSFFVESRILSCVSGQLREDIIMHTGRQLVRDLEFLKQLPYSMHLQICMKLKMVYFLAGDIIFKINTIGDCIYFIHKGTVAMYTASGKEVCHFDDGEFFGIVALVTADRFRYASVVAVSNCELFRLEREDFEDTIACSPTAYEYIKKLAMSRYERTCVLEEHHRLEMKMEENYKRSNK